jgi:type IV pilus assembly protein PilC
MRRRLDGDLVQQFHPIDLLGTARFASSMGVMLGAGIGVVRALDIVAHSDPDPKVSLAADQSARNVESGMQLSTSLAKLNGAFDGVFVRMIMAGESSGDLSKVLLSLAEDAGRRHRQSSAVKQALAYPAVIFGVSMAMTAFMVYYMLPRFLTFFNDLGSNLPWPTRVLMFIVFNPTITYGVPVSGFALLMAGNYLHHNPRQGRVVKEFLKYRLPVIGTANRLLSLSAFCQHLSLMGNNGVGLVEALKILERGSGSPNLDEAVARTRKAVLDGNRLSEAMAMEPVFPKLMVTCVASAEEGSNLYAELARTSKMLGEEAESKLDAILPMLEPLLMGLMGMIVGFIVLATFLPIYQLVSTKI